jgi:hypothetical protein
MKTSAIISALAAGLLLTAPARAITAVAGDLILGFRASGGQGAATNLEVNLGSAATYYGAAPGSSFVVTGLSTSDLVATYGGGWASRSDLSFGIVGTTGATTVGGVPARTIWASRAEDTPGTSSTPWLRGSVFTLQVPSGNISSLYSGAPGSLSNFPAAGSPTSALVSNSLSGSWTAQEDFTPGVSFRYFNPSVLITMDDIPSTPAVYDGVNGYAVLDLFEVRPGTAGAPATLVGAFGLNSNGQLVFSTSPSVFAPVPEPTVTLSALGGLLMLTLRRRRIA